MAKSGLFVLTSVGKKVTMLIILIKHTQNGRKYMLRLVSFESRLYFHAAHKWHSYQVNTFGEKLHDFASNVADLVELSLLGHP